jgi:hypothetical protein
LISEVKTAGEVTWAQTMEEFKTCRGNMELWYSGIKAHVEKNVGGCDGKGKGDSSGEGKSSTRIDKKDISVSKLPDDLDKLSFRHWVDAVDQQLEAVHGFKHASFVMNEIRRSDAEITAATFTACLEKANVKIGHSLEAMGIRGEALNGVTDDRHGKMCGVRLQVLGDDDVPELVPHLQAQHGLAHEDLRPRSQEWLRALQARLPAC